MSPTNEEQSNQFILQMLVGTSEQKKNGEPKIE